MTPLLSFTSEEILDIKIYSNKKTEWEVNLFSHE